MPSVSVPLKDAPGWDALMRKRREFWKKPENYKLSPRFVAAEFACHDGSVCADQRAAGDGQAVQNLPGAHASEVRCRSSAVRLPAEVYNRRIGGARHSQHIYEHDFESVAADMRFARGSPAQWAAEAKRLRTKAGGKGGVGRYDRSGFVHVDNRGYKADWSG